MTTRQGLTYTFTYNSYNDIKTISVGGELLVTNNYQNESSSSEIYTGTLENTVYSYGTVYFEYDEEKRVQSISEKSIDGSLLKVIEYTYNDYSEIASYTDYKEGVTYYYNYDYQNRLINVNATNGNTITYEYDESSRLIKKTNINGSNTYGYSNVSITDEENEKLISENLSNKFNINYSYSNDSFAQLGTISYFIQTNAINKNYTYETTILDGTTYYTGRVKSFEYISENNQLMKYIYTYDKNNNITNISGYENDVLVYQEENTYDIYGQIIMQYVLANGKEIGSEYMYDVRGNILLYYVVDARTNQILCNYEFFYNQTGNKNKLVKVKSLISNEEYNIEYSTNGEPSLYLGWTIAYNMKSITTLLNSDYEINYTYNASGIRTSKVVTKNNNTTTTEYILDGTNIIKEIRSGENNAALQYFYDSNNEIVGFTYNNVKYLYLKNLQNDIIGIVDSNNNIVVKYYYNAYGKIINKVDTSGINLSDINPFRYRGYYQDNETGWYYLNSRYYDVETLRFITMDDVDYLGASGSVLSYNLYSYCENNPINNSDSNGNNIITDFLKKLINFNKKTKLLTISRSLIAGSIDLVLAVLCIIPAFAPVGDSMILLQGVKNIGKLFGRSFVERVFKKVFSKKILKILFSFITWVIEKVTGFLINFAIGTIFDKLFGLFWSMSSLGNFIGATFDLCDGKYDGYFRIYVRG